MPKLLHLFITILILLPLVSTQLSFSDDKAQPLNSEQKKIQLASLSSIVLDANDETVLVEKNPNLVVPIASITKLMTAMVILDSKLSLKEKIRFSQDDKKDINHYFSRIRIGSKLSRGDTLKIALMASENLASAALARTYPGGSRAFVMAMNLKAEKLGMTQTRFVDSTGLSVKNVSTAKDLSKMVLAASRYDIIKKFSTTAVYTARFKRPRYKLGYTNTNVLVRRGRDAVKLSKTGYLDEAGRCLVMLKRLDNKDMVIVLLDSFGKLSPIGDVRRISQWLKTGKQGKVARAARHYEQMKLANYSEKTQ